MADTKFSKRSMPCWAVRHLGMELHGEEPPLRVFDGGDRTVAAAAADPETGSAFEHRIAVAHPDHRTRAQPGQQRRIRSFDVQLGPAILPPGRAAHGSAQQPGHQLHAVTDAQDGYTEVKELLRDGGSAGSGGAGRAA